MVRLLLGLLGVFALFCMVLLIAAGWYRWSDHVDKLNGARAGSFELISSVKTDSCDIRAEKFELLDSRGRVIQGYLTFPDTVSGPLPVVLILAGHGTGARAVELVKLNRPAVLCGMDYPAIPQYRVSPLKVPSLLSTLDSLVLDAAAMALTALDYLCTRPEVDTTRITVLGASFGVPFAVIAGLDERVDGMALLYGGADLERVIDWNLRRKIHSYFIRKPLSLLLGTLTAPYEPGSYVGRFAPRPLLIVNGTDDERMPARSVMTLFESAGEPKEMVWIDGSHIHPSNTQLIESLTSVISSWMERRGLL